MRATITMGMVLTLASVGAYALDMQYPIVTDAYINSHSPTQTYGASATVEVLIDGRDGSLARGLFRLPDEMASLDPAEIHQAIVVFYVFSDLTGGRPVTLYPLTRGFVEGSSSGDGCTWQTYDGTNAWTTPGGDYDVTFPVVAYKSEDNYFRWDITALLTNAATRSNLLNNGAMLIIDETPPPSGGARGASFISSDSVNPEKPFVAVTLKVRTVFPITQDTYVDSRGGSANTNFGNSHVIRVLVNSDTSVTRGLFALPRELADYPAEDIFEARVRFYVWQDNTKTRDIVLYPLMRSFIEGSGGGGPFASGATWNTYDGTNTWTTPGGDYDSSNGVVGVKGPVLDTNQNDRFFTWDVTGLLTNELTRSNLLLNGAILIITGENSPPASGSDRAPFTSSDDLAYPPSYRPHVSVALRRRDTQVRPVLSTTGIFRLEVRNPMPHIAHRIERSFDLQASNGWQPVHTLDGAEPNPAWSDPQFRAWTNVYYRVVLQP